MRPTVRFLSDALIERIVSEARDVLCKLGVEIHNEAVVSLLSDHGGQTDGPKDRVRLTPDLIDKTLRAVPTSFALYDVPGNPAVDLSGMNVNFTPGSTAINILDITSGSSRAPTTADYIRYTRLMSKMDHIASQ
ncbi:MAG: trimethylamine methyltransferase family protein, partial [Phycisphaerales bacterium]